MINTLCLFVSPLKIMLTTPRAARLTLHVCSRCCCSDTRADHHPRRKKRQERKKKTHTRHETTHQHGAARQVLPVSFFERGNNAFFNSVVVFDADGRRLGLYRKSHIPDGPGYQVCLFSPAVAAFGAAIGLCCRCPGVVRGSRVLMVAVPFLIFFLFLAKTHERRLL